MKKVMTLVTMLLFFFLTGSGLAEGAVWFVDGNVSVSGEGRSWTTACKYIQEAIDRAQAGDEIWVKQGSYQITDPILVNKYVRLYGKFTGSETQRSQRPDDSYSYIDGQHLVAHCLVVSADAVIDGFYIVNGGSGGPGYEGGGIQNFQCSPDINDCGFLNNQADYGGAIANLQSSPRITNCFFQANEAAYAGGAIANRISSHPSCKESTFSNNRASQGGAVSSSGAYGGTYDKCLFANNGFSGETSYLSDEGGAVHFAEAGNNRPVVHLVRCQFQNNKAKSGGAVYLNHNSFASTSEIRDCIFTDNRAEDQGGAILQKGEIPIVNCEFVANCAGFLTGPPFVPTNSDNKGGAISIASDVNYHSVTNCRFAGNWAFHGGAIFAENYFMMSFANSTFKNNHASRGGAISVGPQDPMGSMWKSTRIMNCFFYNNRAEEDGGALYGDSIKANILHCTFIGNSCNYYGGAIRYAHSLGVFEIIYIDNSILWGNTSQLSPCEKEISMHEGATVYVKYSDIDHDGSACGPLNPDVFREGNIHQDPLFTTLGNFHLQSTSPCIDAGDIDKIYWIDPLTETVYQLEYDLDGDSRLAGDAPDMGADEFCIQVDILPGVCPNIIDPETTETLQVALLGSENIAVESVDPKSVKLVYQGQEIGPSANPLKDVGQPVRERSDVCDCPPRGRDGFDDLVLTFDIKDLTNLYSDLSRPQKFVLSVQGEFINGVPFTARDCLSFKKQKKLK